MSGNRQNFLRSLGGGEGDLHRFQATRTGLKTQERRERSVERDGGTRPDAARGTGPQQPGLPPAREAVAHAAAMAGRLRIVPGRRDSRARLQAAAAPPAGPHQSALLANPSDGSCSPLLSRPMLPPAFRQGRPQSALRHGCHAYPEGSLRAGRQRDQAEAVATAL